MPMKKTHSLVAVVIVTFILFNIFSFLLSAYYIKAEETSTSLNYAKESMLEIVEEKSELISIKFDRLKTNVKTVGALVEESLRTQMDTDTIPEDYIINENGIVTRRRDPQKQSNVQSNVLASCQSEARTALAREIVVTEIMDIPMGSILENEDVIWGYIVTENNFLRVSPYLSLEQYFDDNHRQNEDIFYTMAKTAHNPQRESIITKPYNDYLGTGWTVTCSQPIYDANDKMFGVVCLDVSIGSMANELFDGFSLGNSGQIVWLASDGNIYFHSAYSQSSNVQGEIFEKNIFTLDEVDAIEKEAFRTALSGGSGIKTFQDKKHNPRIMVYAKIENLDSYLVLQMDMNEFTPRLHLDFQRMWLIVLVYAAMAAIFALVLYNHLSKPMHKLVERANRISNGDYRDYNERDAKQEREYYEIATLNEAFSTMSRNITLNILAEKEMRQMEKMAGVGQLSAAIVHELKNVFARMKGALYIIDMTKTSNNHDEEIETLQAAVKEAEDIMTALLDFSKENQTENAVPVTSVINQILLLSNKDIISRNIRVNLNFAENCPIYAEGIEALKVILQNLILNAIQAIGEDGQIDIALCQQGENTIISIADNGPGITIEPKERIFEPFVTTKKDGSGIGLWITKRLTEGLGGRINVKSCRDRTEFMIMIPTREECKDGKHEQNIIDR